MFTFYVFNLVILSNCFTSQNHNFCLKNGAYLYRFNGGIGVIHYSAYPIKSQTGWWAYESSWSKLRPVGSTSFHLPYRTLKFEQSQRAYFKISPLENVDIKSYDKKHRGKYAHVHINNTILYYVIKIINSSSKRKD